MGLRGPTIAMTAPAPVMLASAPIGFRAWTVLPVAGRFLLGPAGIDAREDSSWRPGVNRAHCRSSDHVVPTAGCECGLHAYHDVRRALSEAAPIKGAVCCWGDLHVGRAGLRGRFAQIVAIAASVEMLAAAIETTPPTDGRVVATSRAVVAADRILASLTRDYAVPLVPLDDLATVAAEYGGTVPADKLARI